MTGHPSRGRDVWNRDGHDHPHFHLVHRFLHDLPAAVRGDPFLMDIHQKYVIEGRRLSYRQVAAVDKVRGYREDRPDTRGLFHRGQHADCRTCQTFREAP